MIAYPLTSLDRLKEFLEILSSTSKDVFLQNCINRATGVCESHTKRKLRARSFTEYQDGDGKSRRVYLKQYPVIGTTSDLDLYDDIDRGFTSSYKFATDDYVIYHGQGIVELLRDASLGGCFSKGVQNIKIIYNAGYEEFNILTGYNDAIDFNEGGSELNATLDEGAYTGAELATEIDTQLEDAGAGSYTVTFNPITCKFTLTKSAGTFQLLWSSGTNAANNAGDVLGFVVSADDTGALTYTADYSRIGVPEDLEEACIIIAADMYKKSWAGDGTLIKKSESTGNPVSGTTSFRSERIPVEAVERLEIYVRRNM